MEYDYDLQRLRTAAFELQTNRGDLIKLAGAWQKVKDWWNVRKNRKYLKELQGPVDKTFRQLDDAIRSHDAQAIDRITSTDLPELLSASVQGIEAIRDSMLSHHQDYVGKEGDTLAGGNLRWVGKGYNKEKPLIEKLWDRLPEEFRSEIPIGQSIERPISNFSWYQQYNPQSIYISDIVKNNIWKSLERIFDLQILESGFQQFLENIKYSLLNDSILVEVNFSPVSKQVNQRYANEMRVEVRPSMVYFPTSDGEVPINIDKAIFTDLGTSTTKRKRLSLMGVYFSTSNKKHISQVAIEPSVSVSQPLSESTTASDGPITKIVKRALLKRALPSTQAIVKVRGQTFEHRVQFATVLASALRQEIDAECSVRHQDNDIEIQVEVYGSKMASLPAIFGISKYLTGEFLNITKIGVDIEVVPGISKLAAVESNVIDQSFRMVAFDCWRSK